MLLFLIIDVIILMSSMPGEMIGVCSPFDNGHLGSFAKITGCFQDASGGFNSYRREHYDNSACTGVPLDVNILDRGRTCMTEDVVHGEYPELNFCETSLTPWEVLPPHFRYE